MTNDSITKTATPSAKIALFRSLFRGREDIYPQRFESRKTGKAGYSPACGNEWVRGICEKPKIKCSECRHQCFLPITDEVVETLQNLNYLLFRADFEHALQGYQKLFV